MTSAILKETRALSPDEIDQLLNASKNLRYKVIILLMVDCGLRTVECTSLKYSDFDFKGRCLKLKSPARASKNTSRWIPLSDRLFRELGNYIYEQPEAAKSNADSYLFPARSSCGHLTRSGVQIWLNRVNKLITIGKISPITLRRQYARQRPASKSPQLNTSSGMDNKIRNEVQFVKNPPMGRVQEQKEYPARLKSWFEKLASKLAGRSRLKKPPRTIQVSHHTGHIITIGRKDTIQQLQDLAFRRINTVILGSIGVGKSQLLDAFEESVKNSETIRILKMDDTHELKSSLAQMLVYILKTDQQGVYDFLFPGFDYTKAVIRVSRGTAVHIAKEIVRLTEKKHYTLIIDNVDRISPKSVKILELLKDHFTIITTARSIPVDRSSFIWNFDIVRLQPLNREFSIQLIHHLSEGLNVKDFSLYQNHIYEQTYGNPRAIAEMIERYRKEPVISQEVIRLVRHTGALPEYDCTFLVLLFLACVACLRYLNHEVQNASFRVLGGIALVFLFITRYFFKSSKRKNV